MKEVVAHSELMREVIRLAERVAVSNANVLITGESGVGKDAVAAHIHGCSPRAMHPFVKIDCASLPSDLLEAELFGYERGAFTGASEARPGRLEAAHKGTLLLDEIAHLSTGAQAKLLRVIEQREFERLGGRRTIRVDSRLMALTNINLDEAVRRRTFREDLYYRLNVVHLDIAPLRARREDIGPLAERFLKIYSDKHGSPAVRFTSEAMQVLMSYDFPGNVRELANIVERGVIVTGGTEVDRTHLPESVCIAAAAGARGARRQTLAEVEADYITETLKAARGNKSEAARMLGISRKNLYEKLSKYKGC